MRASRHGLGHSAAGRLARLLPAFLLVFCKAASAQYGSTVSLVSSPNPSTFGASVTLTATVSSYLNYFVPTGMVTFYDGTTVLGSNSITAGTAAISTILLSSGNHSLTAYYGGNDSITSATSPALTQTVNAVPASSFNAGAAPSVGSNPNYVAVGDFNGDGKADLAVANAGSPSVSILLGNGNGTFAVAANYAVGSSQNSLTVGDFNGDGKADLAVADSVSNNVSILLGNGDGTFASAVNYALGVIPYSVTTGDFNSDGKTDLAIADGSNNFSILVGNGDGTFAAAVNYTAGSLPSSVAVGDFNGDGAADLAIANRSGDNVSILLGSLYDYYGISFAQAVNYATGSSPISVAVGDFNADGKIDLAVANSGSGNVSVLLGNGDGTFASAVNYGAGTSPYAVTVGDFNGDGKPDLAVANNGSNNLSILLGNGDGTFATAVNYTAGSAPTSAAVGDFNGDGKADLAVANSGSGNVTILLGVGPPTDIIATSGTPQATPISTAFISPLQVIVKDSNNNPVPGVTVTFAILRSSAGATLSSATAVTDSSGAASVTAIANTQVGSYAVTAMVSGVTQAATFFLSNTVGPPASVTATGGTPQSTTINAAFTTALQVAVKDAGNNPVPGVTVTFAAPLSGASAVLSSTTALTNNAGIASITALANAAAGSYSVTATVPGLQTPATFALTNGKGSTAVLLVASPTPSTFGGSVTLTANVTAGVTGTVTFYDGTTLLGSKPVSAGAATISTIMLSSGTHSLRAYYGGDSNFLSATSSGLLQTVNTVPATTFFNGASLNPGGTPSAVAVGDFNGDGKADLAVLDESGDNVNIFLGNGNGTFAAGVPYAVGSSPASVAIGDFNGDGTADLAVANYGGNNVSILLGKGDGTFAAATSFGAGSSPTYVTVADFNGDGKADLAVANNLQAGVVSILLGNGDGTFATAAQYPVGTLPASLAVGDFNGDGKTDLAVGDGSLSASILLGNGDGTFAAAASAAVGMTSASVVAGDFNGDGKADLAFASGLSTNVTVLLGNGDGTFATPANYAAGLYPSALAVGDFNGDGKADLAFGSAQYNYSDNQIAGVLLGNGDGTFAAPMTYAGATNPQSLAVGDFNGDGRADLALGNPNSGTVSILLGAGLAAHVAATGGTPQSAPISTAFTSPLQVTITDSNNNPVPGVTVTFADSGPGASATLSSTTAVTDNSGVASVIATANTTPGNYSVSASVPGLTAPAVFALTNLIGLPVGVIATAGTPQIAVVNTAFSTPLQVTVTDASNNSVAGVTVTFAAPLSGASAILSSATAVTNSAGVASVTAKANGTAASYSVTASVTGVAVRATFALTNTPGLPAAVTAAAGTPQTAAVNTAFNAPLQVTVTDAGNNPVAGVTVTFAVPAAGATAILSSATAVTNSAGAASVTAKANGTAAGYSVTASIAGITAHATFALTNTPGPPAAVTAIGGTPQSATVNAAFSAPLQVKVTDAGNNPVSGVTVTFAAPPSGASAILSSATAVTNSAGAASVTAKANGTAATYSLTASVSGVLAPATFTLTNVASVTLSVTTTALPGGTTGVPYSAVLASVNGTAPLSWSSPNGSLPAGLTLSPSGTISGTPTGAGSSSFTVEVTDSSVPTPQTASASLTIVIASPIGPGGSSVPPTFTGLPATQPPSQAISGAQMTLPQTATAPVSGTVTLGFTADAPGAPSGYISPTPTFAGGTTTYNFTLAPGASVTVPDIQPGTVAGTITLNITESGQTVATSTVVVPPFVPVLEAGSVQIINVTATGFDVEFVASSSTPLDVSTATFTFNAAPGAQIVGNVLSVPVDSQVKAWYANSANWQYGSAFSLTVPFTLSGSIAAIQSVTVTLTNSVGSSAAGTGTQ